MSYPATLQRLFRALVLISALMALSGCLEINSVDQPPVVFANTEFQIEINYRYYGPNPKGLAYGAVKVPSSAVLISADAGFDGVLSRDASLEAWLESRYPTGVDYSWWATYSGNASGNSHTAVLTLKVLTLGSYSLDYYVGDDGDYASPFFDSSLGHLLNVLMDADFDGLDDDWEELYFGNLGQAANDDPDIDNLSNLEEWLAGTNPVLADTDEDGFNDDIDSFPLDDSEWIDTDKDGIGNNSDADDDNDGVPDGDDYFPLDISQAGDKDGDGSDSLEEVLAGTNYDDVSERPYWRKTFNGDGAGDRFGISVSGAGDVDGDGYADLIVGAYWDDNNGPNSGSARVFSGIDGSILYTFNGDNADDRFGRSVSGAGDVNGDGYTELIVGAQLDDNNGHNSGSARVFSGIDGSILYTFSGDGYHVYFGSSVSGAGDVNGDGYADLIIGANGDCDNGYNDDGYTGGSARVFSGANGSVLYHFNGDAADDGFGCSVSDAGDVNNDGYADLIVGAYKDDNNGSSSGSARVFSGVDGAILYTFNGDAISDYFGYSVSGAGDVNGDGYADLIIGAFGDDNNGAESGAVRVFSGANGAVLYTFNGDGTYDWFGKSVSGAGDVNGDGYADLIVGADLDNNGSRKGSARIFSGIDGVILYTLNGDAVSNYFGYSVAGAGDVDDDGYADIIVGAYRDDNNGSDSGSARVFLAKDLMADRDLDFLLDAFDDFVDEDGDGVKSEDDAFPYDSTEWLDTDGDGIGNNADWDDDNDGVPDVVDADPLNAGVNSEVSLPLDNVYKGGISRFNSQNNP